MFKKRLLSVAPLLAVIAAVMAFGASSASAAIMGQAANTSFLAVYGNPGTNGTTLPVGGGIGRNFGFGENMLFQAGNGVGTVIKITLLGKVVECQESVFSGTLMSNKTGEGNPLSFIIQDAEFQDCTIGGENTAVYSDTFDRTWNTEICGKKEAEAQKECRIDPLLTEAAAETRTTKIEDVSFLIKNAVVGAVVVQGTVWGKWENGAAKVAPCITLEAKPVGAGAIQNLIGTQGAGFAAITAISGKACLTSANNDWFTVGVKNEPAITLKNNE